MSEGNALPVESWVTGYAACAVPRSYPGWHEYMVAAEWRGPDQWAVVWRGECLGKDGTWDREPSPSSRTDSWKNAHRHDVETALRLALEVAPKVMINSSTAANYMAWYDSLVEDLINADSGQRLAAPLVPDQETT